MRLSIAIQHHPSRPLPGPLARYEVIDDPEPNGPPSAIRTYIECLRATPDCTHRLVLQDDVQLVPDFEARVLERLAEHPSGLVAFFVPGMGIHGRWLREAAKRRERWCQLPSSANWVPTVALCWPREWAIAFLPFAEQHVADRARRGLTTPGDDPAVGRFVRAEKLAVWATIPCLVQHPDLVPSIIRRREYRGQNPARRAAVFVEE